MATYKAKSGQSIYDISLMFYGTIEAVHTIISNNPQLVNIDFNNFGGLDIIVDDDTNTPLTNLVELERLVINTSDPVVESGFAYDEGFSLGFYS